MAQDQAPVAVAGKALAMGHVLVEGRLVQIRRVGESGFAHLITMAAPDKYTSPQTVEVLAKNPLAREKDVEVTAVCRIGGYRRSYKKTDEETGTVRTIHTADVRLYAVEA
jgi:hypothetical protein